MHSKETITSSTIAALQQGQVTQLQYEAFELFITRSLKIPLQAKKVLLWFLRQSNFLQKNIALTIPYTTEGTPEQKLAWDVALSVHNIGNMLYAMFNLIGLPKHVVSRYGVATKINENLISFETGWDSGNQRTIPMNRLGYTIWLSHGGRYTNEVELLEYNLEEINQTKLRNTYSHLSSSDRSSDHVRSLDDEFYEEDKIPFEYHQVRLVS